MRIALQNCEVEAGTARADWRTYYLSNQKRLIRDIRASPAYKDLRKNTLTGARLLREAKLLGISHSNRKGSVPRQELRKAIQQKQMLAQGISPHAVPAPPAPHPPSSLGEPRGSPSVRGAFAADAGTPAPGVAPYALNARSDAFAPQQHPPRQGLKLQPRQISPRPAPAPSAPRTLARPVVFPTQGQPSRVDETTSGPSVPSPARAAGESVKQEAAPAAAAAGRRPSEANAAAPRPEAMRHGTRQAAGPVGAGKHDARAVA